MNILWCLSRRCKKVENVYEIFINTKIPFPVLSLTIEYTECTSSFFKHLAASGGLKQAKRSDPHRSTVKKTRLNYSKDNFIAKALACSQNEN